jgi:predicted dinucleotide-binding enzyme
METHMTIAILGSGNMAKGLASVLGKAGYKVTLGSRNPAKAEAAETTVTDVKSAAAGGDIVFLAVPYSAAAATLAAAGDLSGKILVDLSNPLNADYSGLAVGHDTSAAEEIQKLAPKARVVKAFNTIFASIFAQGGKVGGTPATVFIAGDDEKANATVAEIAGKAGFAVQQSGALKVARYLEPLAFLNISLGYGKGLGTAIAPAWLKAA